MDVNIAAYCLMTNNYHTLLQTPNGNISRYMRPMNSVYTQRFALEVNEYTHRTGVVFLSTAAHARKFQGSHGPIVMVFHH